MNWTTICEDETWSGLSVYKPGHSTDAGNRHSVSCSCCSYWVFKLVELFSSNATNDNEQSIPSNGWGWDAFRRTMAQINTMLFVVISTKKLVSYQTNTSANIIITCILFHYSLLSDLPSSGALKWALWNLVDHRWRPLLAVTGWE